ncbi:MAG: amidohydrolase family protein [Mogibacterium sp.]|nr:amidohydrolase family protein [Mogibacterium sp.]
MLIQNVRLLPELSGGCAAECGAVRVEDGKIREVFPDGTEPLPQEPVYDAGGKTLLPGLIDLHTHITLLGGVGDNAKDEPMQLLIEAAAQAKKFLRYGYTTIRDCGSYERCANYVRNMVRMGLCQGPDVVSCGNTMYNSATMKTGYFVDGVDGITVGVRKEAAYGADFIKIYASGSAFNPAGVPLNPIMTREEIQAAVDTAKVNGLSVAAHCHADGAIRACIEYGVKTIEHATYITDETTDLLLATEDCYLVPTLAATYVSQTDPEERKFWLERLTPMRENVCKAIRKAYDAGAIIGFGTDSAPGSPMYEQGIEFRYRAEDAGMAPLEILKQATVYNAEILGIEDRTGSIRTGLQADLILVDGKPDEDISCMYHPPYAVWKGGVLVHQESPEV